MRLHDFFGVKIDEHIVKVKGGYRLVSKHGGKNLGTYPTHAGAEKRERQVQYFKHAHESVNEAERDVNFDAEDLKRLEGINDLNELKKQAFALISNQGKHPMKPAKVSWFRQALAGKTNKMAVIKMMYDLMLSGEGHSVLGTKGSMAPNSYRKSFGEEAAPAHMERAWELDLFMNMGNGYWVGSMLHDDGDSRKVSYELYHTSDAKAAANPMSDQFARVWQSLGFLDVSPYRATKEEIKAAAEKMMSQHG